MPENMLGPLPGSYHLADENQIVTDGMIVKLLVAGTFFGCLNFPPHMLSRRGRCCFRKSLFWCRNCVFLCFPNIVRPAHFCWTSQHAGEGRWFFVPWVVEAEGP